MAQVNLNLSDNTDQFRNVPMNMVILPEPVVERINVRFKYNGTVIRLKKGAKLSMYLNKMHANAHNPIPASRLIAEAEKRGLYKIFG